MYDSVMPPSRHLVLAGSLLVGLIACLLLTFTYQDGQGTAPDVNMRKVKAQCDIICDHGDVNEDKCTCECWGQWQGSRCDCWKQCKNGGILDAETCTCNCVNGYRGTTCIRPPCTTPCVNGTVNQANCRCQCNPGWSGRRCDCSLTCQNGGYLHPSSCRCSCVNGYRGDDCSLPPCETVCDHGRVNQDSCTCDCWGLWRGSRCDCWKICQNGGILDAENCTCNCINGWRGNVCTRVPCDTECINGTVDQNTCKCICNPGYFGTKCDCDLVCQNEGYPCGTGGCSCTCVNGYRGIDCSLDPCDTVCEHGHVNEDNCTCECWGQWKGSRCDCWKECVNGGILDAEKCECNCVNGYRGNRCQKPPCTTVCINGTVNQKNCRCECNPGWSGRTCNCSLTCQNGGYLQRQLCRCLCANGYRGDDCSLPPCETVCDHGRMNQDNCACECWSLWKGSRCDCWKQCQNNGILDAENCTCNCVNGYRGDICSRPPCTTVCVNGTVNQNNCRCKCNPGWSGRTCDCPKTCQNNGTLNARGCFCTCVNGYRGDVCEMQPCQTECVNGTVNETNCQCQCNPGWSGPSCNCSLQCDNGGRLYPRLCRCRCVGGYRGPSCSDPPCNASLCVSGIQHPQTCNCHCTRGWRGTHCDCNKHCRNGGTLDENTCTCACANGYRGDMCALLPCTKVCYNGTVNPTNCACECSEGWSGSSCECRKCENGGKLYKTSTTGCGCVCTNGYRGPTCSLPPCDVPCSNGWVNQDNCNCECYLGWSGAVCDCERVCDNAGILDPGTCTCNCTAGFSGPTCRRCQLRCTEPEVLSPATCQCEVPVPCNATCDGELSLYSRTCVCIPAWVNCGQFDAPNCRSVVEGGYCSSKSNQASCPQACGLCESHYIMNQTEAGESGPIAEDLITIDKLFGGDCGDTPLVENSKVTIEGYSFMSLALYVCNDGYTPSGFAITQCEEDGSWLPVEFTCDAIKKRSLHGCGPPPHIPNMDVTFNQTSIGALAEYRCLDGYIATGLGRCRCQPNELWSIPSLSCKEKPSSWILMASTSQGMTPKKDKEILGRTLQQACQPVTTVLATTGSESTLYYMSVVSVVGDDIISQSAIRRSKQNWNTFSLHPHLEFYRFQTNGDVTVGIIDETGIHGTSKFTSDFLWFLKNDTCLEESIFAFFDMDLFTKCVLHPREVILSDVWLSYSGHPQTPARSITQVCIDTCWHSVRYSHDIIDGVSLGHDLVVTIDGVQTPALDIIVYNKQVTVTVSHWLPSNGSTPVQVSRTVPFHGEQSQCTYSPTNVFFTRTQSTFSWFMDSRPWSKVLSTSGDGTVLYGSTSGLISSLSAGKNIRLGVLHSNNMHHYMGVNTVVWKDRGEVAAEVTHHPSIKITKELGIRLSVNCQTWAAIITTEGLYHVYEYSRKDDSHTTLTDLVSIDWFVC